MDENPSVSQSNSISIDNHFKLCKCPKQPVVDDIIEREKMCSFTQVDAMLRAVDLRDSSANQVEQILTEDDVDAVIVLQAEVIKSGI